MRKITQKSPIDSKTKLHSWNFVLLFIYFFHIFFTFSEMWVYTVALLRNRSIIIIYFH